MLHPIKVDFASQVIGLMLNHPSMKIASDEIQLLRLPPERDYAQLLVAGYQSAHFRNTEASLPILNQCRIQHCDLRIDQVGQRYLWHIRISRVMGDLEHCDLNRQMNLWR